MREEKQFLSVAEVAKKLGISRVAVFKRIRKGDIRTMKVGRAYIISQKDFYEFKISGFKRKRRK